MTFGNDSLVWSISADYSVFTRGFFSSFINELSRLETAHTLLFVASEIFSWSTQTVNNAAVQICITIFAHEQKSSENFVRWFTLLCIFREKTINSQRIGKLFQVSFFSIRTIVLFFSLAPTPRLECLLSEFRRSSSGLFYLLFFVCRYVIYFRLSTK